MYIYIYIYIYIIYIYICIYIYIYKNFLTGVLLGLRHFGNSKAFKNNKTMLFIFILLQKLFSSEDS